MFLYTLNNAMKFFVGLSAFLVLIVLALIIYILRQRRRKEINQRDS